jgi:protein-disulfide isomerase
VGGQEQREKQREESRRPEANRRTRLLRLSAGIAFLAVAAVVVLIVVNAASNDGSGDTDLEGVGAANRLLDRIPQHQLILGDLGAPVELREYGDLQCPFCKAYSEQILPPIIEGQVRKGEVALAFRDFPINGDESVFAAVAALAAGEQQRGWNFIEIFYRNQGKERSGYVTEEFLEAVAKAAGVKDLPQWNKDRKRRTEDLESSIKLDSQEAKQLGFTGTPSFSIRGPGTNESYKPLGTPESTAELEEAIKEAR